jgi:hypothetical protein
VLNRLLTNKGFTLAWGARWCGGRAFQTPDSILEADGVN